VESEARNIHDKRRSARHRAAFPALSWRAAAFSAGGDGGSNPLDLI
jgi:hypothetical protein